LVFAAISLLGQTTPQEETTRPQQTERPAPAVDPSKPPADIRTVTPIAAVDPKSFQIGAEDILLVQVWREPDFTRQVMVRPDGKITMPLIGEVQAGGLTPEELTESLTKHLQEILKNPQVLVAVLQVNSKKYYITGEVARPGAFPLVVPTRVLEALTSAGGFREFANKKKITVLRKGERLKFNYNEVVKGKNMEQNILLENGDYIVVP
jgi:polysaccharide export outer membrane protein